jgi:phospholipid/cholesterol/gamma-HCH transport system ATP-binding protein
VDIEVREGETVALMGPSGSGKSVLLKIISGLIPPDAGEVIIGGENVTKSRGRALDHIRERIGMVFQINALFDSLNVGENVAFALRAVRGIRPEDIYRRVREALNMVKLGAIETMRIPELSGGMKKRVGIARALIARPAVLLTDDPTAGLDPVTAMAIIRLLMDLRKNFRSTGIVVTSTIGAACMIADRIAFLDGGAIIAQGTIEELKLSTHQTVQNFIEAMS